MFVNSITIVAITHPLQGAITHLHVILDVERYRRSKVIICDGLRAIMPCISRSMSTVMNIDTLMTLTDLVVFFCCSAEVWDNPAVVTKLYTIFLGTLVVKGKVCTRDIFSLNLRLHLRLALKLDYGRNFISRLRNIGSNFVCH